MRLAAPIDLYFLVIIAIVRVASWFPYRPVRFTVAIVLARVSYHLSLNKRAAMTRALTVAFEGRLDNPELARIVKASLFDTWLEILGSIPNGIDVEATRDVRVIGWEHLERALAAGKGVLLWESGAFGRRFWTKQILLRKGLRVHQIYGANHISSLDIDSTATTWVRRSLIRPFFDDAERPYVATMMILPSSGDLTYGRTLLHRLKENAAICLAADGEVGVKFLAVPFLGTRCGFATGMVSLARLSGATILPIMCWQAEDGKACLHIEEAIRISEKGNREQQTRQCVLQFAELLERFIRREPGLYRNWHLLAGADNEIVTTRSEGHKALRN